MTNPDANQTRKRAGSPNSAGGQFGSKQHAEGDINVDELDTVDAVTARAVRLAAAIAAAEDLNGRRLHIGVDARLDEGVVRCGDCGQFAAEANPTGHDCPFPALAEAFGPDVARRLGWAGFESVEQARAWWPRIVEVGAEAAGLQAAEQAEREPSRVLLDAALVTLASGTREDVDAQAAAALAAARELLADPAFPPDLIGHLAMHAPVDEVRQAAVADLRCPVEALAAAAEDDRPWVRSTAVASPRCPEDVISRVALNDRNLGVRRAALTNKNCGLLALGEVARFEPDGDLRVLAAAHPGCEPAAVAHAALNDEFPHIRLAAVRNPRLPADVRAELAGSDDPQIRDAALEGMPAAVPGSDRWVTDLAWARLDNPDRATGAVLRLLGSAHATPVLVGELAQVTVRGSHAHRVAVADARCPREVIDGLLASGDSEALAHPSTGPADVAVVASAADWQARNHAAKDVRCPAETLAVLASGDAVRNVRAAAVTNPACPPATVADRAVNDPEERVRFAALNSPACPESALRVVASEPSGQLRLVAQQALRKRALN